MSEAPPFWYQNPGIPAWSLFPVSFAYGKIAAMRMNRPAKAASKYPTVCVGNFVAGGAGKTPTAVAVAKIVGSLGYRPGFLSRGYGAQITAPVLVDTMEHDAMGVGDEPLILAQNGPTVVAADRVSGLNILEQQPVDFVIMDDGFQNPSLQKDFSLVVIDSARGLGNGHCIPSGPVRADLRSQLAKTSAVLRIGEGRGADPLIRMAARMAKPVVSANIKVDRPHRYEGIEVLAYSGIADPGKFHRSLAEIGAVVEHKKEFHDHHPFTDEECSDLLSLAREKQLTLITTEKDSMRLKGMGDAQEELLNKSEVLMVHLQFENPKQIELMLDDAIRHAAARGATDLASQNA